MKRLISLVASSSPIWIRISLGRFIIGDMAMALAGPYSVIMR
jgi:hypothetical protein